MKIKSSLLSIALALLAFFTFNSQFSIVYAQGTAFTYQGRLNAGGVPANGLYDFRFKLASDPLANNYVGDPFFTNAIPVTNGLFVAPVDFGMGIFAGSNYWMEVDVRTNNPLNTLAYTPLTPLQAVTPTPYAVFANTASNVSGTVSAAQIGGAIANGNLPANPNFSGTVTAGAGFAGNGANLTALNANNLASGTVPLAQLNGITSNQLDAATWQLATNLNGGNAALASNLVSGISITNAFITSSIFAGNGGGLTNLNASQLTSIGNTNGGAGNFFAGQSGNSITSGSDNTANGFDALYVNTSGSENTANGAEALFDNTSGSNNIALGYQAGYYITTGSSNIDIGSLGVLGDSNLIRIGSGQTQTYIAGVINGDGSGLTNINASKLTSISGGFNNFFIGSAGNATMDGAANTAIGYQAFTNNTSGAFDTAIGGEALFKNTLGAANTAIGYQALYFNTTGSGNIAIGQQALSHNSTGSDNIALGNLAGDNNLSTNSDNIDIGNEGLATDNGIIRIGSSQTAAYIAGTIYGDGSGLANVWLTGGNSGTTAGVNYLGTADDQPMELHVSGVRVLRLEPTSGGTGAPNVIGGYPGNLDDNAPQGVTIGGGGAAGYVNQVSASLGTIAGGSGNTINTNANDSTIGGGRQNTIDLNSWGAVISGGHGNWIQAGNNGGGALGNSSYSVIGGGYGNIVGTNANNATIGGGGRNTSSGNYATIPGGYENLASGLFSLAAGYNAQATNIGVLVWSDGTGTVTTSTNNNSVTMRASGGYRFFSGTANTTYAYLAPGSGSWTSMSDRNVKENFRSVSALEVLERVAALPVATWNYKTQPASIRHIGPTAQDFKAAFAVGETDTGISTVDEGGVALAAIQGLNQKLNEKDAQIQTLKQQNDSLAERLNELEATVKQLAAQK